MSPARPKSAAGAHGRRPPPSSPTAETCRADPLFSRIEPAVLEILAASNVVAPVDVLVGMRVLRREDVEKWRRGQTPFLERVVEGNLSRLRRFLRILGLYCHDLNLTATSTAYVRWGKGPKTQLRFTKTGDRRLEKLYARHFVWPGKGPFHPPAGRGASGTPEPSS